MPCKPLVELTYHPCLSQEEYIKVFEQASNNSFNDFVEGIVYSKERAVIMTGKMVPFRKMIKSPFQYNPIGFWWKTWFYKHVEGFLEKPSITYVPFDEISKDYIEYVPLRDYFHRHTRSIFWVIS